jgi:transcriptional repressor NrdR
MVVKKDGRRESFDRLKLRAGILKACEKRPVSIEHVDAMVEVVERKLHALFVKEVPSRQIGDYLMEELRKVDTIAYVRFASVYREFSDVNEFVDTLEKLRGEQREESAVLPSNADKAANDG